MRHFSTDKNFILHRSVVGMSFGGKNQLHSEVESNKIDVSHLTRFLYQCFVLLIRLVID